MNGAPIVFLANFARLQAQKATFKLSTGDMF